MDSNSKHAKAVRGAAGASVLALLLLVPMGALAQEPIQETVGAELEQRREHQLSSLPPLVREAIRSAAPDMVVQQIDSYLENDFRVYRARGRLLREMWFVTVREDGRVMHVISDFVGD